jgi:hypothetical protein
MGPEYIFSPMRNPALRFSFGFSLVFAAALSFSGCASLLVSRSTASAKVYVAPSESLLLRVEPFDSVVKAELVRGGLDPVKFEEAFNTELRYRFTERKQEGAFDSSGAQVILTVRVDHLQPGAGNVGAYGALRLQSFRKKGEAQWSEWEWRKSAKYNVAPAYLERHMLGLVVDEVMSRTPAGRPRPKEPPPPLQLLR